MNLIDTERSLRLRELDEKRVFQGLESKVSVRLLGSRHGLAIGEGGACHLEPGRNQDVINGATRSRSITVDEASTVYGGGCGVGKLDQMALRENRYRKVDITYAILFCFSFLIFYVRT